MNTSSWQAVWLLAVEVAAVVVLTLLIAWRLRSVVWQRTLWQASLIALIGLLVVEFSSVSFWKASPVETPVAEAAVVTVRENLTLQSMVPPMEVTSEPVAEFQPAPITAFAQPEIVSDAVSTAPVIEESLIEERSKQVFPLTLAIALGVWVVGSVVLAMRLLVGRFLLLRFCARSQMVFEVSLFDRVQEVARKLGMKQPVQVLETARIQTPVVFGLFRLTIALPAGFTERFERRQQEAILAHELAHLAARDPLWYLLADALVSVLWWHPLVWVARARLQVASELAADEACVLAKHGPETLAECLVSIAKEMHGPGALESIGIEGSGFRSRLGQRVERLLTLSAELGQRPSVWRTRLVKVGMPVVLVAVLLLGSGWMRQDGRAPWSGMLGGAWELMVRVLKAEELQLKRDPRRELKATSSVTNAPALPVPAIVEVSARVKGKVFFEGKRGREADIEVPAHMQKYLITPLHTRFYEVSADNGLGDTLVYIKHGLEGRTFPTNTPSQIITFKGLQFYPYMAAVQTGQKVEVRVEDGFLINLSFSPTNKNSKGWNKAMLPQRPVFETRFTQPEFMARIRCDAVPWAYTYLNIFDHPYFAVTDAEGRFEFSQPLPPGHYTLAALHRQTGMAEMEIEVKGGEGRLVEFVMKAGGMFMQSRKLKAATEKKLDELILPELYMDGLLLDAALQYLTAESKRLDPEKEGIQFEWRGIVPVQYNGKPGVVLDPWGVPIQMGGNSGIKPKQMEKVSVSVNPGKKGLSFRQVLETVCAGADVALKYHIQNGVVVFSADPDASFRKKTKGEVQPKAETRLAMYAEGGKGTVLPSADRQGPAAVPSIKLDSIKLPRLSLEGLTLEGVARKLEQAVSGRGETNAVLRFGTEGKVMTSVGGIEVALVTCTTEIKEGMSLRAALDLICEKAGFPVQYMERGDRVIFQAKTEAASSGAESISKEMKQPVEQVKASKAEVSKLVQEGKELYEKKQFDEAEAKLREAVKLDPANSTAAYYYMNRVEEARYEEYVRKRDITQRSGIVVPGQAPKAKDRLPTPNPYVRTQAVQTVSKSRQRILAKLDQIVFKEFFFDGLPLTEVVRFMQEESVKQDPEKLGINFIINSQLDDQPASQGTAVKDPLGARIAPRPNPVAEPLDLKMVLININPALKNLTMRETLNAITNVTANVGKHGLAYTVEDYGVVFHKRVIEPPQLFTRVFKVDAEAFEKGLHHVWAASGLPEANTTTNLQDMWREFIRHAGVTAGPGGVATNQVFYNDKTGVLLVRADMKDLEIIQSAIEVMNLIPPQVQIEAQYIEVPEKVAEEMGLKWFANGLPPDESRPVEPMRMASMSSNHFGIHIDTPQVPNHVSVLSPAQAKELQARLEKAPGINRLSAPRVTTANKRQAQISVVDVATVVVGRTNRLVKGEAGKKDTEEPVFITDQVAMGPVLDVIPSVFPDGKSMRLDWVFSLTEFFGYDKPEKKGELPEPQVRRRQVSNQNVIQDGYTLVAGCGMAEVKTEAKKGLFHSGRAKTEKKMVLILMTAYLIDPSGNRINRE